MRKEKNMSLGRGYLATLKGKKVTFKVVNSFPDLKVQFVDSFGDYKVKVATNNSFSIFVLGFMNSSISISGFGKFLKSVFPF